MNRTDAAEALLAQVPVEALDWAYIAIREEDRPSLRLVVQSGMTNTEADAALKIAAREAKLREAADKDDETADDPKRKPPR